MLRQFLAVFFFVVIILLAVISVIDMTDKMDKFAKAELSSGAILGYYLDFLPWIGSLITPITIFIATVFVCSRLAVRTEIIAMLSAGVSFRRYLVPYFVGAGVVAILSFILNGWIIPDSNKTRLAFEVEYLKGKYYYDKRNIHIQVAPDVYLYLQSYNNNSDIGYHFTLERFEGKRLVEKLTASRIQWDSTKEKWTLYDYKIKHIDQVFESQVDPEAIKGFETTKTALVRDSVISGARIDSSLVIHPKEFESDYRKFDGMTIPELKDYIATLHSRGSTGVEAYEVELYSRYTSPFTIFILVFMGVIVSSRKSRGGTGLQIALGFALSFAFILFFTLFRTFAEAGSTPPILSVWIPNIVFTIISIAMYKYVPR